MANVEQSANTSQAGGSREGVAPGSYECWANGRPRLMLNFTIQGNGRYLDPEGKNGAFHFNPATTRISFRNGEGYEVSYCERSR